MNPRVNNLHLFDIEEAGVAADLSHISTDCKVKGFHGPQMIEYAIRDMDLVICPAGVPRKPGMTRDDLFNTNAGIVAGLSEAMATYAPKAWFAIISNPVNSMVPMASDIYDQCGACAKNIFGVTTLDLVRAEAFISEMNGSSAEKQKIPVIGGHAGSTIIPLLSKSEPPLPNSLSPKDMANLTTRIQDAGTEVVKAKNGSGSATLTMAMAAARFSDNCLIAQSGESEVDEYAYVKSDCTNAPFFSSRITLNQSGIKEVHHWGDVNEYEQGLIDAAVPQLNKNVYIGENFSANYFDEE